MTYDEKMTVFLLHLHGYIDRDVCQMLLALNEQNYERMKESSKLFSLEKIKFRRKGINLIDIFNNNFHYHRSFRATKKI